MREVREEAEDDEDVRPDEDALEHLVVVSSPKRLESAFDTGDQPAGQAFRPSAMSDACQSRAT